MAIVKLPGGAPPRVLRQSLRESEAPEVLLRRAVIGASLLGMAAMAVVTLFQSGLVRHLADPPLTGFDSDKVNASDTAYGWGMPDAPISILAHAVTLALATLGGADRARKAPWVPVAATAVATPPAATSAAYLFYDMPVRERGWCPYCIADALAHIAVLGFTLFETKQALSRLRG